MLKKVQFCILFSKTGGDPKKLQVVPPDANLPDGTEVAEFFGHNIYIKEDGEKSLLSFLNIPSWNFLQLSHVDDNEAKNMVKVPTLTEDKHKDIYLQRPAYDIRGCFRYRDFYFHLYWITKQDAIALGIPDNTEDLYSFGERMWDLADGR